MHKTSRHDIKRFTCHSCIEQQKQNKCWNCRKWDGERNALTSGWNMMKYSWSASENSKSPISTTHLWVSLARSFSSLEIFASLFVTCLTFCKLCHITPNTSSLFLPTQMLSSTSSPFPNKNYAEMKEKTFQREGATVKSHRIGCNR